LYCAKRYVNSSTNAAISLTRRSSRAVLAPDVVIVRSLRSGLCVYRTSLGRNSPLVPCQVDALPRRPFQPADYLTRTRTRVAGTAQLPLRNYLHLPSATERSGVPSKSTRRHISIWSGISTFQGRRLEWRNGCGSTSSLGACIVAGAQEAADHGQLQCQERFLRD
jgi:hypothetical protein